METYYPHMSLSFKQIFFPIAFCIFMIMVVIYIIILVIIDRNLRTNTILKSKKSPTKMYRSRSSSLNTENSSGDEKNDENDNEDKVSKIDSENTGVEEEKDNNSKNNGEEKNKIEETNNTLFNKLDKETKNSVEILTQLLMPILDEKNYRRENYHKYRKINNDKTNRSIYRRLKAKTFKNINDQTYEIVDGQEQEFIGGQTYSKINGKTNTISDGYKSPIPRQRSLYKPNGNHDGISGNKLARKPNEKSRKTSYGKSPNKSQKINSAKSPKKSQINISDKPTDNTFIFSAIPTPPNFTEKRNVNQVEPPFRNQNRTPTKNIGLRSMKKSQQKLLRKSRPISTKKPTMPRSNFERMFTNYN